MRQMRGTASASDPPDACIAGGSAHTVTAGMAIHNADAAIIAKLADLATGDQRSPLFGAGNAGVVARSGRLFRRDDEGRSESYAAILGRASLTEIEARGKSAADPETQSTYAMHAHGAVFAEVKVDPDLVRSALPALSAPLLRGGSSTLVLCAVAIWRHKFGACRSPCTSRLP